MKADNDQHILAQIQKRMDELRRLDEEGPSSTYAYLYDMNPPLQASRITALEQQYQIALSDEYRLFLQEIANGSTDPLWGLFPLEEALQFRWDEEDENRPDFFRAPFVPPASLANADDRDGWGGSGLLLLEQTGCGECSYLVVSGAQYGQIWQGQPQRLFPAYKASELPEHLRATSNRNWEQFRNYLLSSADTRLTFLSWWYQRLYGGW